MANTFEIAMILTSAALVSFLYTKIVQYIIERWYRSSKRDISFGDLKALQKLEKNLEYIMVLYFFCTIFFNLTLIVLVSYYIDINF